MYGLIQSVVGIIEAVTDKYQEIEKLPDFEIMAENIQKIKFRKNF